MAGTTSLDRGTRILGTARADLAAALTRRYEAGESIRSIAADLGRSYGFVQGLLKESGVPLRSRGGATRGAEAVARREATAQAVEQVRAQLAAEAPVEASPPKKAKKSDAKKSDDKKKSKDKKAKKSEDSKDKKDKKKSGDKKSKGKKK